MFANNFIQEMSREFLRKMKHFILLCSKCNSFAYEIPQYFVFLEFSEENVLIFFSTMVWGFSGSRGRES